MYLENRYSKAFVCLFVLCKRQKKEKATFEVHNRTIDQEGLKHVKRPVDDPALIIYLASSLSW